MIGIFVLHQQKLVSRKKTKRNKTKFNCNTSLSIWNITREQSKAQPDHIMCVLIPMKKILSIVPSFYRYELQDLKKKKLSSKEANSEHTIAPKSSWHTTTLLLSQTYCLF
ncbi:unnamed protein product [Ixodes pacificus]